jgi:hypothetical protein
MAYILSGFGITRLKCLEDVTGDLSEKWSTNFKQLEKVYIYKDNWYVRGNLGQLYFLKSGFPARVVSLDVEKFFITAKAGIGFAIKQKTIDIILLGTGDKLFTLGKLKAKINKIELIENSIYLTTEEPKFYKLHVSVL